MNSFNDDKPLPVMAMMMTLQLTVGGRSGVSGMAAVYRVAEVFCDVLAPARVLRHCTAERRVWATPCTSRTVLHHVQVSHVA